MGMLPGHLAGKENSVDHLLKKNGADVGADIPNPTMSLKNVKRRHSESISDDGYASGNEAGYAPVKRRKTATTSHFASLSAQQHDHPPHPARSTSPMILEEEDILHEVTTRLLLKQEQRLRRELWNNGGASRKRKRRHSDGSERDERGGCTLSLETSRPDKRSRWMTDGTNEQEEECRSRNRSESRKRKRKRLEQAEEANTIAGDDEAGIRQKKRKSSPQIIGSENVPGEGRGGMSKKRNLSDSLPPSRDIDTGQSLETGDNEMRKKRRKV